MTELSRREFTALAASVAAAPFLQAQDRPGAAITAQHVIDRMKKNVAVEWKPDSVDNLKAGDPSTVVSGVATTSMATMAVLRRAVQSGANLIITAHPTFYSRADALTPPAGRGNVNQASTGPDPVFTAKNEFITRNNLVVFRFSEHWRLRRPDPFAGGMAAALGWSNDRADGDPLQFDIPATTLNALVSNVKKRLECRGGVRVVGDRQTRVQRVGLLPGTTPIQAALRMLPHVDVIIAGEVREWESVEYVRDKVFAGEKKGLILVGRVVSEEAGMSGCATWLKTFVPEVPVHHISAGDPYWRPVP